MAFTISPPAGEGEVRAELLWDNPHISSPSQHLNKSNWRTWIKAGITQIHHICHLTENRIMGQEEITQTHNIKCNFLEALSLRTSIPHSWRAELSNGFQGIIALNHEGLINDKRIDILSASPRQLYAEWIREKSRPFSRDEGWKNELDIINTQTQLDWPSIHVIPYRTTRDTKLQSFAFRIVYRLVTCNKYLHKIRIAQVSDCSFCGLEDSISHFFLTCHNAQRFWQFLHQWCENHLDISISQLSAAEKLLGITRPLQDKKVVNWIILQAKFFIHRNKLFHNNDLALIAFLAEMRAKLYTEQRACQRENKANKFRIWRKLFNALG